MRRVTRFLGVWACGGVVFLAGGCAGTPAAPSGATGVIEDEGATLVADDLFPPGETERRTARMDPESGDVLGVEVTRREMLDGSSWITRTSGDEGEQSAGEMIFRREGDGSVALVSLVADTPEAMASGQARYVFEPPLTMAPARLEVGEMFEHSCDLRIVELDDASSVIKTGSASRRLEVVGRELLELDSGSVETIRVRARFRLQLGATRVTNDSIVWVEPGSGAIAESTRRVVRVLGVPVQDTRAYEQRADTVGD